MCDKLYLKQGFCNPRIDKCLVDTIKDIITKGLKPLASCCGHGKYPTTIVVRDKKGKIFELYSGIELGKRKRNRYYKRDKENYYYIPEVEKGNDYKKRHF